MFQRLESEEPPAVETAVCIPSPFQGARLRDFFQTLKRLALFPCRFAANPPP